MHRLKRTSSPAPAPVAPAPSTDIALGAYLAGAPSDLKIDEFAQTVGATPSVVMWYQDWEHSGVKEFDPKKMDAVASKGAMPMVTWEPYDWSGGASQPKYALKTIIAGDHDDYIRQWAKDAAAWDKPMYLRFAHEMNGDWYPWGVNVNGNSTGDYVTAWKHVHDIFQEESATNVKWVWSPNVTSGRATYSSLYPGDAYTDWVGIDGYNWGTSQSSTSWLSLSETFAASYKEMDALNDKPMMIAETGSTESGGDKAGWIKQGLLSDLPTKFPQVKAVVWFNTNKETDWRVNSSAGSLAAYKEVAASPSYQGTLP